MQAPRADLQKTHELVLENVPVHALNYGALLR